MTNQRLGRIESPDDRDRNYPMRSLLPATVTRTRRFWYQNGAWWDQGNTGTCVGHAWGHYVEDGPVTHAGRSYIVDPIDIYLECTKIDDWPGNDNGDLQFGTSVRAGAKVLEGAGIVSEYLWAWKVDTVVQTVLTTGPVVLGTNWYDSMFFPNSKGLIEVKGSVAGGHAYVLNGVNTKTGLFRIKNSWNRGWGRNGNAFISIENVGRLIGEDGEACIAVEALTPDS